MFDFHSFHWRTEALFLPHPTPARDPDFVSPGRSVYWDTQDGVIRASDHWVGRDGCDGQASCRWALHDDPGGPGWRTGWCSYEAFTRRAALSHIPPQERDSAIAHWLLARGGACTGAQWAGMGWGTRPAWLHHAPRGSLALTPAGQALLAQDPALTHVLCARAPALHAARDGQPVPWM